jgi:hypothetical protein
MVDDHRLSAGEPSGCLASGGRQGKLIYFDSDMVVSEESIAILKLTEERKATEELEGHVI